MTDAAPASPDVTAAAAVAKAALYLRVSTGRQAESDLLDPRSAPGRLRPIASPRAGTLADEFVEPGNTATDDRRPAFQAMIDAALVKPQTFTVWLIAHLKAAGKWAGEIAGKVGTAVAEKAIENAMGLG